MATLTAIFVFIHYLVASLCMAVGLIWASYWGLNNDEWVGVLMFIVGFSHILTFNNYERVLHERSIRNEGY